MAIPENRKYTAREFFELMPETGERCELINGEIVYQAAPGITHQRIVGGVYVELSNFIKGKGDKCSAFVSPCDVKLDEITVVQPDVFVVCDSDRIDDKFISGAPDLVIEVVSTNRSHDYLKKFDIYRKFGVREYWIIDPLAERVIVYLFSEESSVNIYTFEQPIPVRIYDGELTITIGDVLSQ